MDTQPYKTVVTKGVMFAFVAAVAFGAGIAVGNTGSAAAVVAKVPLIGDGLNATPDQNADLANFWKAWNTLHESYVVTHASSTVPSNKDLIYGAIQGLADAYGDPYTTFLPPKESAEFAENISGSFAGVGMEIDVKDEVLTVITPLKGTPAEKAGIKAGDQIIAIDKKPTDGLSVEEAVRKIRGPLGSTVELSILRAGKPLTVPIVRATIQIPQTEDGLDKETGVYHITLYEFTSSSVNLFNQALSRFKASGSKRLVVDLRGNPGGYLDVAVNITSHFLPKGTTIVTEDFDGKRENKVHQSLGYNDLPRGTKVVVLIDGGSASASEIVAGALQDAKVATVIGTKSFGKGSVQQLIPLGEGSLKVTIARWVTPSGKWIMGNGITPDIVVPVTQKDLDEDRDPQMDRAIQFLTTGR
jgi:carboxyl-terminal processing protease